MHIQGFAHTFYSYNIAIFQMSYIFDVALNNQHFLISTRDFLMCGYTDTIKELKRVLASKEENQPT